MGRALDRLFDADRSALITEVALASHERFGVTFEHWLNEVVLKHAVKVAAVRKEPNGLDAGFSVDVLPKEETEGE